MYAVELKLLLFAGSRCHLGSLLKTIDVSTRDKLLAQTGENSSITWPIRKWETPAVSTLLHANCRIEYNVWTTQEAAVLIVLS